MSQFAKARELLRASLITTFGKMYVLFLPDDLATPTAIRGYVKTRENDGIQSNFFYCHGRLPAHSKLSYEGRCYTLAFAKALKSKQQTRSQITYEYVMTLADGAAEQGTHNGWSEF